MTGITVSKKNCSFLCLQVLSKTRQEVCSSRTRQYKVLKWNKLKLFSTSKCRTITQTYRRRKTNRNSMNMLATSSPLSCHVINVTSGKHTRRLNWVKIGKSLSLRHVLLVSSSCSRFPLSLFLSSSPVSFSSVLLLSRNDMKDRR